jgi:hypothetical protein
MSDSEKNVVTPQIAVIHMQALDSRHQYVVAIEIVVEIKQIVDTQLRWNQRRVTGNQFG